jgi:hypothetical protein
LRDITKLKAEAKKNRPSGDPYRVAVEALPDTVADDEYLGVLRILIPLARAREE